MREIPKEVWDGLITDRSNWSETMELKDDLDSYLTGNFWKGGEDVLINKIVKVLSDEPLRAIEIMEVYGLNETERYSQIMKERDECQDDQDQS